MLLTIIALTIVFLSIIINKFIVDPQLQYIYWLVVFLLFVSVSNIYMTIYYYTKLRNEPGIKGERGDPGGKGQGGSNGVCEINTGCGAIENCRNLIEEELLTLMPEYANVLKKRDEEKKELNAKDNSILRQVNGYVGLLEPKCKSGRYTLEEMKKLIADSFKN
jgi:hypothetical protein